MYLSSVPYTGEAYRKVVLKLCEYRLSYFLLPLIFAIIGLRFKQLIINELSYFVYGCFGICLLTNVSFALKYAVAPGSLGGVGHVIYRTYFEDFSGLHPTYISLYIVLALGFLLIHGNAMSKYFKYILFITLIGFLLPLLAKAPLIALVLIFMHQSWIRRKYLWNYKWVFLGLGILLLGSYLFVPFVSQRIQEMTQMQTGKAGGNITDNSINVRKMIFNVDTTMLKHYWLCGTGTGRLMHILGEKYFFYSLQSGYYIGVYDPHNEYFYQWLSFGIAGILVLLATLYIHFRMSFVTKNFLYQYLLISICITFFTESLLATQHGIIFYSFFTSLFFFYCKGNVHFEQSEN